MIEIKLDTGRLERSLLAAVGENARRTAMAKAMTRVAASARTEVISRMDALFDRPTPFTRNSVRYEMATRDTLVARVYISDDANRGLSPHQYLRAEIQGGDRRDKKSERSMQAMGVMLSNQQWVPGRGMNLDAFGNVAGSRMVTMMSRVGGFREVGYRANATAKTRKRLVKQGVAVTAKGFDYFVKRGKGGKPIGVYKVVSAGTKATPGIRGSSVRGQISPQLVFTNKRASYKPRFPFREIVMEVYEDRWNAELLRALREGMR